MVEEGHRPGMRTYDRNGNLIGESGHEGGVAYLVNQAQMTRDASRIFVPRAHVAGRNVTYALACLDRNLRESWRFDMPDSDGMSFHFQEDRKRVAVCWESRENCALLDFEGKTVLEFETKVDSPTHLPRISRNGKSAILIGGYRVELYDLENGASLWQKAPPVGIGDYRVAYCRCLFGRTTRSCVVYGTGVGTREEHYPAAVCRALFACRRCDLGQGDSRR